MACSRFPVRILVGALRFFGILDVSWPRFVAKRSRAPPKPRLPHTVHTTVAHGCVETGEKCLLPCPWRSGMPAVSRPRRLPNGRWRIHWLDATRQRRSATFASHIDNRRGARSNQPLPYRIGANRITLRRLVSRRPSPGRARDNGPRIRRHRWSLAQAPHKLHMSAPIVPGPDQSCLAGPRLRPPRRTAVRRTSP